MPFQGWLDQIVPIVKRKRPTTSTKKDTVSTRRGIEWTEVKGITGQVDDSEVSPSRVVLGNDLGSRAYGLRIGDGEVQPDTQPDFNQLIDRADLSPY